jgi:hypothetical protein
MLKCGLISDRIWPTITASVGIRRKKSETDNLPYILLEIIYNRN